MNEALAMYSMCWAEDEVALAMYSACWAEDEVDPSVAVAAIARVVTICLRARVVG